MALKKGICKNFDYCDIADKGEPIEADDSAFVCPNPNCRKDLAECDWGASDGGSFRPPEKKRPELALLKLLAFAVIVSVGIWALFAWIEGHPRITAEHAQLDFEFQSVGEVGESARKQISVTNTGTGILKIKALKSSSPAFTASSDSSQIKPDLPGLVHITFAPPNGGEFKEAITILSNDKEHPVTIIAVSGSASKYGKSWLWDQLDRTSNILNH